ncbi:MAG TPA: hypothetical protein VMW74_06345 [Nitrosopumilaceae archaeon]|nr:hypothetical protein [Nitrosopumilaceae archaeon]
MSCSCNGICSRQKIEPVKGFASGQKYCSVCAIYITTENVFCQCCKRKYRTKKRSRWKKTAPKIYHLPYITT